MNWWKLAGLETQSNEESIENMFIKWLEIANIKTDN